MYTIILSFTMAKLTTSFWTYPILISISFSVPVYLFNNFNYATSGGFKRVQPGLSVNKNISSLVRLNPSHNNCVSLWPSQKEILNSKYLFTSKSVESNGSVGVSITLVIVFACVSYAHLRFSSVGRLLRQFPGPNLYPFIGSCQNAVFRRPEDLIKVVSTLIQKYGGIFTFWMFHKPYIIVTDADIAQKFLCSHVLVEKAQFYGLFTWFFGDGLVTSCGKTWKKDRKLLGPAFKYQRFNDYLGSFNEHSKVLVSVLRKEMKSQDGKSLNLHSLLCRCTMDMVTEGALGVTTSYQIESEDVFYKAVNTALHSFRDSIIRPWLMLPVLRVLSGFQEVQRTCQRTINSKIGTIIEDRKKKLMKDTGDDILVDIDKKPFIDFLLHTQRPLENVIGHAVTIFGAGFETTGSSLNYILFLLATHPAIQEKVVDEIKDVIGDDKEELGVNFSHLSELKYMEMCIKEALRLFPPVPVIARSSPHDVHLGNGLIIPKNIDVLFPIYEIHRDVKYYPSPEEFNPERFQSHLCAERHPYSYLPFSLGPRNCIGQKYAMIQMKTLLCHILRHFFVRTEQTYEDLRVMYGFVLEPLGGIHLKLSPRI